MFTKRIIIIAVATLFSFNNVALAQFFPANNYPQRYFQWPVDAAIGIVANFGELRPNHYHMGLDCRTNQKENMPVLAAASGYIAKVKIEPFGFGRCIYINHPNGLTTLYAHLNNFAPVLEKYITQQQYNLQQWNIFIDLPVGLFKVEKGQFIAYSGSTGGSQGPHTHFEIRDTKTDKVLNPLLFSMPIADNIAPYVMRLAVYDRTKSTYEQTPKMYPLKKVNGAYTPAGGKIITTAGKVSFAITAFDRYTGSTNQNGIYEATLFDNETPVCGFQMDSISYTETRYLNAHIDYKLRSGGGPFLQHLSRLPGYNNGIYKGGENDGVISLENETAHSIKIRVSDANNNSTDLNFTITSQGSPANDNGAVNNVQKFYPGYINVFENAAVSFYLPENSLYDSFSFIYHEMPSATGKTIYQLHNTSVPLHTYFQVKIKDNFPVTDTGKIVMKRFYGSKEDYVKASYENGWYKASFREFGNFQLMVDDVPPTVIPIGFREGINAAGLKRILFSVKDNTEEIKSFTALLDGNWLRFSNDKGRIFAYNFDEHCPPGIHELRVTVEDQAGNITQKNYHFTR